MTWQYLYKPRLLASVKRSRLGVALRRSLGEGVDFSGVRRLPDKE